MKIKKAHIIMLIIFVSFFLIFYQSKKDNSISLEISNDFIKKFSINPVSNNDDSTTFNGKYRNLAIKIKMLKGVTLNQAENYISDKMFVINSLYREIDSPYPGALSNRIECGEEFKPEKKVNAPFDYYIAYASDRFTYGTCSWDLIEYKSIIYYAYCNKTKNLYQIELFVPANEDSSNYEQSLKAITC